MAARDVRLGNALVEKEGERDRTGRSGAYAASLHALFCAAPSPWLQGGPRGADILTLVRSHPSLPSAYVFITRTAFSREAGDARGNCGPLPTVRIDGIVTHVCLAATLLVPRQVGKKGAGLGLGKNKLHSRLRLRC
jgi:hypothetical protein